MALKIDTIYKAVSQYPNPEYAEIIEIKKTDDGNHYWISMAHQQTKTNKGGAKRTLISREHSVMLTKEEMKKLGEVLSNL